MNQIRGKMIKNIVYMGTPDYAREILSALIDAEDMCVELVLTQPDRPVGRKRVLTPPPVKELALQHDIKVVQPNRLSDDGIKEMIVAAKPDYIIVAAFGQILPKSILDIAPCINLHASLLPQYRGASPVQQSLLNGDKKTGVTSMLMEEGLDTGPMLDTIEFDIPSDMRLHSLMSKLGEDACKLTLSTIRAYDKLTPVVQDNNQATLCKKIKKADGEVELEDALSVYNKYRAFEGWPAIFMSKGTKLGEIELFDTHEEHKPFEILDFEDESLILGCANGALKVGTLQPASKKTMSSKAYCVGRGLKIGDILV